VIAGFYFKVLQLFTDEWHYSKTPFHVLTVQVSLVDLAALQLQTSVFEVLPYQFLLA
jgi:hypothetical protein